MATSTAVSVKAQRANDQLHALLTATAFLLAILAAHPFGRWVLMTIGRIYARLSSWPTQGTLCMLAGPWNPWAGRFFSALSSSRFWVSLSQPRVFPRS